MVLNAQTNTPDLADLWPVKLQGHHSWVQKFWGHIDEWKWKVSKFSESFTKLSWLDVQIQSLECILRRSNFSIASTTLGVCNNVESLLTKSRLKTPESVHQTSFRTSKRPKTSIKGRSLGQAHCCNLGHSSTHAGMLLWGASWHSLKWRQTKTSKAWRLHPLCVISSYLAAKHERNTA